MALNVLFSVISTRSQAVERWTNGIPLILVEHGVIHGRRLEKLHVNEDTSSKAAASLGGEAPEAAGLSLFSSP